MSFLAKMFEKQAGGSTFGNVLRGVASKYTQGALGSGAELEKYERANGYRDSSGNYTPLYYAELAKNGAPNPAKDAAIEGAMEGLSNDPASQKAGQNYLIGKLQEFWWLLLLIAVAVWYFLKGKNGGNKVNIDQSKKYSH